MQQKEAKQSSRGRGVNRRDVLGFIGATAAASLVAGASERYATAEQTSASIHSAKSRTINIDAKPQPFAMETGRSAVIVVDMQNDFGSKGGMFERAGIDISPIQKVVPSVARVLASARQAGIKIVYLKMGFRPDLSDLGSTDSPNREQHMRLGVGKTVRAPNGAESRILIRDTWNTDIIPDLTPQADDIVLYKHRFSGFYQTELDAILKKLNVTRLVITGCTTSVCVESTVRDAMFRDYRCLLLADCMAQPTGNGLLRSTHEGSLLLMQTSFAWVSSSEEFVRALGAESVG
jgi:ureidoacrylate peracid hydrolase